MLYTGMVGGVVTLESQEGSFNSNNNSKEKICAQSGGAGKWSWNVEVCFHTNKM